jgi:hypothetical protein
VVYNRLKHSGGGFPKAPSAVVAGFGGFVNDQNLFATKERVVLHMRQ